MHMRDVHPFCPRLSPLADCAFPSRQRTSDLTIARGRRFCADTAVRAQGGGVMPGSVPEDSSRTALRAGSPSKPSSALGWGWSCRSGRGIAGFVR